MARHCNWHPVRATEGARCASPAGADLLDETLDGVRHWLETQGDGSCAGYDLGAAEIGSVDVGTLASLPLGGRFVCPSRATR